MALAQTSPEAGVSPSQVPEVALPGSPEAAGETRWPGGRWGRGLQLCDRPPWTPSPAPQAHLWPLDWGPSSLEALRPGPDAARPARPQGAARGWPLATLLGLGVRVQTPPRDTTPRGAPGQ